LEGFEFELTLHSGWQTKVCQSLGWRQSEISVCCANLTERNIIAKTDHWSRTIHSAHQLRQISQRGDNADIVK
jgi:hypothetical protein